MDMIEEMVTIPNAELLKLVGKRVFIFCTNYNYAGKLVAVSPDDIILEGAGIVFDSGSFDTKGFTDFQAFPCAEWRLRTSYIESYGEME